MSKYNKELIFKYIHGEEIDDCLLKELENDSCFMLEVIKISQDKNLYNLCSSNLKHNYEFIKNLILLRRNDLDFINKVFHEYLETLDDSLERTELILIMLELIKNKDDEKYMEYSILAEAIYAKKRVEIELDKAMVKKNEAQIRMGMGFCLIYDLYGTSDIVLNFYARKMIEEILSEKKFLEDELHKRFKQPKDIFLFGINNYMLQFIEMFDSTLASFLRCHTKLLSQFSLVIHKIQNNWDRYINQKEEEKYCYMIQKVHEYMEEHELDTVFTETDILYFIGKKLGIEDKIFKYDSIPEECLEVIKNGLDEDFYEETIKNNFKDKVHYYNVKKIMTTIIFENNSRSSSDCSLDKGQILKVDFRKKD